MEEIKNKIKEIREKCHYFGLIYLGKWDNKYWAMKEDKKHLPHHGGMVYELTNKFFN